jgi:hypothetical protein
MKTQLNEIKRMQQLAGLLTESENKLEQDIIDFWGTLQDDAAQSDGEYDAKWETGFFINQYPEYKGMESQINQIVKSLDI